MEHLVRLLAKNVIDDVPWSISRIFGLVDHLRIGSAAKYVLRKQSSKPEYKVSKRKKRELMKK